MKRPRGNRRSKVLVENDMIALVERMQLRDEDAKSAGEALGIPATTAQRLARKGLRRVLMAAAQEKIKAIADADSNPIPTMQGQFELPEPEPVQPEPPPQVVVLPEVLEPPVTEPEPVWEWEHLKSYREFMLWPEHRREQWLAQVRENEALGGVRWTPVLRGGIKNRNCFRGCPSYQCTCEDNL